MDTQMTEDYVSFEVAKLLKEKGFEELTCGFYYDNYTEKLIVSSPSNHNGSINSIAAPSQAQVMKWLREVYKKNINIIYDLQKFQKIDGSVDDVEVYEVDIITKNGTFYIGNYNHYESACEAAIKYCLENLI